MADVPLFGRGPPLDEAGEAAHCAVPENAALPAGGDGAAPAVLPTSSPRAAMSDSRWPASTKGFLLVRPPLGARGLNIWRR